VIEVKRLDSIMGKHDLTTALSSFSWCADCICNDLACCHRCVLGDVTKTGMGRRVAVDTVPRRSLQCCTSGVVGLHASGARPNRNLRRWSEDEAKRDEENFIERTALNELHRAQLIKLYSTALLDI